MNVVWSDEATYALVALETKLAERCPAEQAEETMRRMGDFGYVLVACRVGSTKRR